MISNYHSSLTTVKADTTVDWQWKAARGQWMFPTYRQRFAEMLVYVHNNVYVAEDNVGQELVNSGYINPNITVENVTAGVDSDPRMDIDQGNDIDSFRHGAIAQLTREQYERYRGKNVTIEVAATLDAPDNFVMDEKRFSLTVDVGEFVEHAIIVGVARYVTSPTLAKALVLITGVIKNNLSTFNFKVDAFFRYKFLRANPSEGVLLESTLSFDVQMPYLDNVMSLLPVPQTSFDDDDMSASFEILYDVGG